MPFDPYYKWLGIPPEEQPPNHYRLLGVRFFESDPDVIDAAANRTMAYLQSCASDPRLPLAQRLLNEVAAARLLLLCSEKKESYDRTLASTVNTPYSGATKDPNRLSQSRIATTLKKPPALTILLLFAGLILGALILIYGSNHIRRPRREIASKNAIEASKTTLPKLWALYRFYDIKHSQYIYTYGDGLPPLYRKDPTLKDETIIGYVSVTEVPGTRRFWDVLRPDGKHYFYINEPDNVGFVRIEKFGVYVWRDQGIGRIPIHGACLPDGTDLFLDPDLGKVSKMVDSTFTRTGVKRRVIPFIFYIYSSEIPANSPEQQPPVTLAHTGVSKSLAKSANPQPAPLPNRLTSPSTGMVFVRINGGEFLMGAAPGDKDAHDEEKPQHRVRITRPFYLGLTEVTRGQFRAFIDDTQYRTEAEKDGKGWGWNEGIKQFEQKPRYTWRTPGFQQTDDHPVVGITWNDAQAFIGWLSRKEGDIFRLPTEAEWEYACRAGTKTAYYSGDDPEALVAIGNVADGTAKEKYPGWTTTIARDGYIYTAPVAQFQANAFGLYDMCGNVWEWCQDWCDPGYYKRSPIDDPPGASGAASRVSRGGGWFLTPRDCRSAFRFGFTPDFRSFNQGFRVARSLPAEIKNLWETAENALRSVRPPTTTRMGTQIGATPLSGAPEPTPSSADSTPMGPKPGQQQVVLGKAHISNLFTCTTCGATIHQFPVALHAEGVRFLENDCRVHLQSSR